MKIHRMKNPVFRFLTERLGKFLLYFFKLTVRIFSPGPAFYPPEKFEFTRDFEKNRELIRDEFLQAEQAGKISRIQDVFKEQGKLSVDDTWKSGFLLLYGFEFEKFSNSCPVTASLIKKYPQISSAMFSVLAPGKKLVAHRGPYAGVLRYHLGLIIPDQNKCSITVKDEKQYWQEGKSLILDDTFLHFATNDSTQARVVLFIDFIKPLPFPLNRLNQFLFLRIANSPFIQDVLVQTRLREKESFRRLDLKF